MQFYIFDYSPDGMVGKKNFQLHETDNTTQNFEKKCN